MSEVRLIDANALKKALAKNLTIWAFNTSYDGVLAKVIDNAPTIEERPQGEWKFIKANEEQTDGYECSVCKRTYHTRVPYFSEYNYCPNCGARVEV